MGGRNKVGYKEKILSLQELAGMNLAKKKGAVILVREIIFSKFGIMTFNI